MADLTSSLSYRDPRAALDWLAKAFGFEAFMVIEDATGTVVHSEMRFGDGTVMIGGEWDETHRSPASTGGKVTQALHVNVAGVDAHCARARAAGAEILSEPTDQFYGRRAYRCRDPEGHVWSFSEKVRDVTREQAEAASGLKITGWE